MDSDTSNTEIKPDKPDSESPTSVDPATVPETKKRRFHVPHWRWILISLLIIALAVSIFMWKPWQANIKATDRTVSVTGKATITAAPDEYVFSPSYTFKNANKDAALAEMTAKSNEVVAQLKKLGVPDNKIKTNSNGYSTGDYYVQYEENQYIYSLEITATVNDKALAQKVQDYLITTNPVGSITPDATFSDAKHKDLESQARDKAEKDARSKADQSAKNLGFKVGKVKSLEDGSFNTGGGCSRGLCALSNGSNLDNQASPSLTVQPGENDLDYSVNVVYYIH